jgi:hypothetical protein
MTIKRLLIGSITFSANLCQYTIPLLLGIAQALGVSRVYSGQEPLIFKLISTSGFTTTKGCLNRLSRQISHASLQTSSGNSGLRSSELGLCFSNEELSILVSQVTTVTYSLQKPGYILLPQFCLKRSNPPNSMHLLSVVAWSSCRLINRIATFSSNHI